MIRWGILGAGRAACRFAKSVSRETDSQLIAVAARDPQKAEAFAAEHSIPTWYGSCGELLASPEIDAVYLALPHGCHKAWAIEALTAGKAVLCEKPAALTAEEMKEIAAAAQWSGRLFMEAMKPRFTPIYSQLRRLLAEGCIGELRAVETSLCNLLPDQGPSAAYQTEPGQGGALLDCGIYCASWLEDILPGPPRMEALYARQADGVDHYIDARLTTDSVSARLECAFDRRKPRTAVLRGTRGNIVVEELHRPQTAVIYRQDQPPQRLETPYSVDDLHGEIRHFVQCLNSGQQESPVMPLEASIRCAQILDTVRGGLHYTEETLRVLQAQEDILQYDRFGNAEVLALGTAAAELAEEYDRGVGISITRESDGLVLFQYMMEDKAPRNLGYMEGKRRTVLASGHCSLWPYVENAINGKWQDLMDQKPYLALSGGAFPIRVKGEHAATISVSGLHEGKDHELTVRALCRALGKQAPAFPWAAI